jgi:hypothetical protein
MREPADPEGRSYWNLGISDGTRGEVRAFSSLPEPPSFSFWQAILGIREIPVTSELRPREPAPSGTSRILADGAYRSTLSLLNDELDMAAWFSFLCESGSGQAEGALLCVSASSGVISRLGCRASHAESFAQAATYIC